MASPFLSWVCLSWVCGSGCVVLRCNELESWLLGLVHQSEADRLAHGLDAVGDGKLAVDVRNVGIDGALRGVEGSCPAVTRMTLAPLARASRPNSATREREADSSSTITTSGGSVSRRPVASPIPAAAVTLATSGISCELASRSRRRCGSSSTIKSFQPPERFPICRAFPPDTPGQAYSKGEGARRFPVASGARSDDRSAA